MSVISRSANLFRRSKLDEEIEAELRAHIEMRTADNVAAGMSPEEARRDALLRFGNRVGMKERVTAADAHMFLDSLWQDFCYALRMLRKSPGFTAVAVLTLALGIGANTAIFSVLDGLVLRDLPVPHPEQLVTFAAFIPGTSGPNSALSLPMFEEITRDQKVFSGTFTWWGGSLLNIEVNGEVSRAMVDPVGGNFYSQLGASPEIGRLIEPSDVNLNAVAPAQVAVLGYDFWQRNYHGAKDVIGKTLKIEDLPFTIIGVSRKGFNGIRADTQDEIVVPLTAEPLFAGDANVQKHLWRRNVLWLNGAGRLKPGVTINQARAQLGSLWPAIRQAVMPPQKTPSERASFLSMQLRMESAATGSSFVRGEFVKPLYVLLGISGLVLLIACVNLASLMLSRGAARSHELSVRVALGASRSRLARQVLTESLVLSIVGTLAGFGLAYWGSHFMSAFIFQQFYVVPAALNLSPDLRVLGFTTGTAILTGILFGLVPAWCATREDPNAALQQNARTLSRATGGLGKWLIITQVALSLVLLVGAGLFIRTLEKLRAVQPGFRTDGVLEVDLFPKPQAFKNADRAAYFRELTDRISGLSGVTSAGLEHMEIGNSFVWNERIKIHGQGGAGFPVNCEMAMPGFFRTVDISLLRGRSFRWEDAARSPRVALVSENFAKSAFPDGSAIGRRIDIATEPEWQDIQIVGIVSNATLYDLRTPPQPTIYLPTLQYGDYADDDELLVRTNVSPAAILPSIRDTVRALGRHTIMSAEPLTGTIDRSILQQRITAALSAFFGALALLIAAIGLYGLMSYAVTRRTRELGIRLALGAQRPGVLRMILRETLTLTLLGIVIGLPCALVAARFIAHMLFDVTPYDPITLAAVTIALLSVGALAGYIPARRATKVDPLVALRYE